MLTTLTRRRALWDWFEEKHIKTQKTSERKFQPKRGLLKESLREKVKHTKDLGEPMCMEGMRF